MQIHVLPWLSLLCTAQYASARPTLLARQASASAASSSITWVPCNTTVPTTLPTSEVEPLLQSLPATLRCGTLDVPMNYALPMSDANKITLSFSMNRPAQPLGLLNFNPGGPLEEARSYAWLAAAGSPYTAGLESYDFLAIDVRGSYASNPLNCSVDAVGNWVFPPTLPTSQSSYDAMQNAIEAYAASCEASSTPKGILQFLSTQDVIQDWNAVRAALNYTKMSMIGISYGTYGAQAYIARYPDQVENFILDAISPINLPATDLAKAQTASVNRLLRRADALCQQDSTCPFHSQGNGSVVQAFERLATNAGDGVNATAAGTLLNTSPQLSLFNQAVNEALNGNLTGLDYAIYGPEFTVASLATMPAACADNSTILTLSDLQSIQNHMLATAGGGIAYSGNVMIAAACSAWPVHAPNTTATPDLMTPALLVTSEFDLNTPTELATTLYDRYPAAGLLVREGDGHGTINVLGAARDAMIAYIQSGILPVTKKTSEYNSYTPGTPRGPIANPYVVPVGTTSDGDVPA